MSSALLQLDTVADEVPVESGGCTAATNRTVSSTYANGFLTGVTGYASSISYHPNGQVNQVVRANNTTDTWTKDPQNQMRPNKIDSKVTSNGALVWSSGIYSYDGAGNVVRTGNGYYLYDGVSRIKNGLLYLGAGGTDAIATFDHAYDGFGTSGRQIPLGVMVPVGGQYKDSRWGSPSHRESGGGTRKIG